MRTKPSRIHLRHNQRPLKEPIRLSRRHKYWIYLTSAALLCSGIGWLIAHYLIGGVGEFTGLPHPSEPWWLRLHGAAAMAFLIVMGSLLPNHIGGAWRLRKNYRSGLSMLGVVMILVMTGYGLYYIGDEQTRSWISLAHWVIGIAMTATLPLHIWLGTRQPNI